MPSTLTTAMSIVIFPYINVFFKELDNIDIAVVKVDGKSCCSLSVQDDGLDAQDSARIGLKQIADMAESVHAKFIQETLEGHLLQYQLSHLHSLLWLST